VQQTVIINSQQVQAASKHSRKDKQVHIAYLSEKLEAQRLTISWRDDAEQAHTCGWLLSEFLRRVEDGALSTVAIRSKARFPALDCYLTQVDRSLSHVSNGEELEAVQIPTSEVQALAKSG